MSSRLSGRLDGRVRRMAILAGYAALAAWVFGGSLFYFLRFSFEVAHHVSPGEGLVRLLEGLP